MTTAAAQAQALANGLAQSSKSIADSSKATSQYFESFVKRLKEVDNTFNRGAFSQTLKAITGNSKSADESSRSISKLANDYRQLQASVTGGLGTAIADINKALADATNAGIPVGISQITDELLKEATASSIRDFIGEQLKDASEKFAAENKAKEGIQSTASGLQYEILTATEGAKR